MPETPDMRDFITGILRDMEGNVVLSLSSGRTDPSEIAPHGKLIVDRHHWFAYPAELDLMVEFAEAAYRDRRDAYISPIVYGSQPFVDKKGNTIVRTRDGRPLFSRAKANALFSQTIYMDSDACPPEAFRLPPSRHVVTSEGHGHDYWFLSQPIPAQMAAEIAHRITTAHKEDGSDPTGWSPNKVLRLPTFNTTYDELDPFPVTWEDDDVDPTTGEVGVPLVYAALDIEQVYSDVEVDLVPDSSEPLAPVPPLEGLPDFEELVGRIPDRERRLNDLIYKTPKGGPDGWRSEQRYALLLDLKRFGFTDEETIAIAWHSPAASKWREDKRGVDGLWWELQVRVKPVLAEESGSTISAAPAVENRPKDAPKLLSPTQRSRVESRSDLFTLYVAYSTSKVQTPNLPYHVINGWTLLSLGLAEAAELPKEPEPLGLNLFSFTLGKSSSGKDEANGPLSRCVRQIHPNDDPEIAAASSRENLIENLIERHNRITYISENEGDALLGQIKAGGYSGGLLQYWTRAYDGPVPSLGRVGRKDLNKPGMHAILTMRMMGTPSGMMKVLDRDMFYSGYLARQIWVIGDDMEVTPDTLRSKFRRGEAKSTYDGIPTYFGLHFAALRQKLLSRAPLDHNRASLDPTDEAIDLVQASMVKIYKHIEKRHDIELWKPITRRFNDIIWKIAGLSAASAGRVIVGTRDVEIALYYAETWLANAMEIADGVSDTFFSKQCDEIEKFIATRDGQEADLGAIYRFRKGEPKRVTDEYLQSLTYQGRVEEKEPKPGTAVRYYKIKEAK